MFIGSQGQTPLPFSMPTPIPLSCCWAKTHREGPHAGRPALTVRDHCLNVGAVAEALTGTPAPFAPSSFVVWLAACHDIGKVSPGFQSKCFAWMQQHGVAHFTAAWQAAEPDHSKVSQFSLQHCLRDRFGLAEEHAALWAAVAGMHHGTPHYGGQWGSGESCTAGDASWEEMRLTLADELGRLLGEHAPPPEPDVDDLSSLWWTAGFITVADWIGSDESRFPLVWNESAPDAQQARRRAEKAMASLQFRAPATGAMPSFQALFGFEENDLQLAALATIKEPGVYVIEAPMGMGKTEAALAVAAQLMAAGKASGLYFALPTQATSNRIHERVATFLAKLGGSMPRLIHSGSWLLDVPMHLPEFTGRQPQEQQNAARDWFSSSKRALLAPFGVGTVDQALMGVIAVKHFFVRHFALAGKVVILDEVHSYDVYTGTLIEALVQALVRLRCTVIILSATLTRERREKLLAQALPESRRRTAEPVAGHPEPFPLITGVANGCATQPVAVPAQKDRLPVHLRFLPEGDALAGAMEAAQRGACVLWICNTVDRAQATYRALCSERCEGGPPIALLHSRFPFFRREELETEWMRALGKKVADQPDHRPHGCILISTQIVEQSVDLDADLLITELAPTDMLFQRMGRLWRHPRGDAADRHVPRCETWIIAESRGLTSLMDEPSEKCLRETLGKKARVYSPYVLLRALEQWHDKSSVSLPGDIRPVLEASYAPRDESERPAWKALLQAMEKRRDKHRCKAEVMQGVWQMPSLPDDERAGTRLDECPTIHLLPILSEDRDRLTLLDGTEVTLDAYRFNYATARALHRNLIKAPCFWFDPARFLKSVSSDAAATIQLHIRGEVEAALFDGRHLTAEGIKEGDCLEYSTDKGLALLAATAAPLYQPSDHDDESYD